MELIEQIDDINDKLLKTYGTEILVGDKPRFRVVFSDDQYEKRWTKFTDEGFELIHPEIRLMPKYKTYITAKYVLERLVPIGPESDLVEKVGYEPAWVFQHAQTGEYLPPRFDMCEIVIESLMTQMGRANTFKKYKDPEENPEYRKGLVDDMYKKLFGNETSTGDALAHGYGVTVPENKLLKSANGE